MTKDSITILELNDSNSVAAIIWDGKLVLFACEERFNRLKLNIQFIQKLWTIKSCKNWS